MATTTSPQAPRYWLLTAPRTASNMLVRILNLPDQGVRPSYNGGYFFMGSREVRWPLQEKPRTEWTDEEVEALRVAQQKCFDDFHEHIEKSEAEGQLIYVKEHVVQLTDPLYETGMNWGMDTIAGLPDPTLQARGVANPTRSALNKTSAPDEFLKTWKPTFLIRHPAMVFPSFFRARFSQALMEFTKREKKELRAGEATFYFNRTLFDFFDAHFREQEKNGDASAANWPIVLDADDVMKQPELVTKYAAYAGLDPEKLTFTWEETSTEDKTPAEKRMLSSLHASTGVDLSKLAGDIDISAEGLKWRSEFGEEGGAALEKFVRDAMPDYEYMLSRRLKLD